MTTKQKPKVEGPNHYYASTAFNWAVAQTRKEAIESVARMAGADIIKINVKNHGGLYVWSCRVLMPESTHYSIHAYAPHKIMLDGKTTGVAVPLGAIVIARIQNTKGHLILEEDESFA